MGLNLNRMAPPHWRRCVFDVGSSYFSAQMWEKAIELGKQLAKMHESHMFDFMELSQLLVSRRRRVGTPRRCNIRAEALQFKMCPFQ